MEGETNSDEDSPEEGGKKYIIKPLTKYEENQRAKAHERHKQNIVHEQKCWGKTFTGAAFISKPDKIFFKDFDLGETYTQTIVLTNVSFTFNSFKLLPLDGDIKEFFTFEFTPPGRLSAGLTCPVVVSFTPKMNKDINSTFPILSETGRIDIPLICTCKKTVISVDSTTIDVGEVILGEQGKRVLTIKNEGALDCKFVLLTKNGEPILNPLEPSFAMTERSGKTNLDEAHGAADLEGLSKDQQFFGQLAFPKEGHIEGYSTSTVPFLFSPVLLETYEEEIILSFANKDAPTINLILRASSTDVPLSVEKSVYDLDICPINTGDSDRIDQLLTRDYLPKVLRNIKSKHKQISNAALKIVGNIATGTDTHTQVLLSGDVLGKLMNVIGSKDSTTRQNALWVLGNIAAGSRLQITAVYDHSVARLGIQALTDPNEKVRMEASFMLYNTVKIGNSTHIETLITLGVISYLRPALLYPAVEYLFNVLTVIEHLLRQGKNDADAAGDGLNGVVLMLQEHDCIEPLEILCRCENERVRTKAHGIMKQYIDANPEETPEIEMSEQPREFLFS